MTDLDAVMQEIQELKAQARKNEALIRKLQKQKKGRNYTDEDGEIDPEIQEIIETVRTSENGITKREVMNICDVGKSRALEIMKTVSEHHDFLRYYRPPDPQAASRLVMKTSRAAAGM